MGCGASVPQRDPGASATQHGHDAACNDDSVVSHSNALADSQAKTQMAKPAAEAGMAEKEVSQSPTGKGLPLQPRGAASSFARLFREYAEAQGVQVPVSWPHYDPLMDEIYAVPLGERSGTEPLVSPKYVMRAAEILAVDLLDEAFLVPVLKALLPSLSAAYQMGRLEEELCSSRARLAKERQAALELQEGEATSEQLKPGPVPACEECSGEAVDYCPACEGFFCHGCFEKLHAKGRRAEHPRLDVSLAGFKMRSDKTTSIQVVNVHWHPFHDESGLRYYYNFQTHRSVRNLSRKELNWRPPPPLP